MKSIDISRAVIGKDMTPAERRAYVEGHVAGYVKHDRKIESDAVYGCNIHQLHESGKLTKGVWQWNNG